MEINDKTTIKKQKKKFHFHKSDFLFQKPMPDVINPASATVFITRAVGFGIMLGLNNDSPLLNIGVSIITVITTVWTMYFTSRMWERGYQLRAWMAVGTSIAILIAFLLGSFVLFKFRTG